MITNIVRELLKQYGATDGKELIIRYIYALVAWLFIGIAFYPLPLPFKVYYKIVTVVVVFYCIAMFFFRKKKNSNEHCIRKRIIGFVAELVFRIVCIPYFIIEYFIDYLSHVTNKVYLLQRNSFCFTLEIVFHLLFMFSIFVGIGNYVFDAVALIAITVIFFCVDKASAFVIRWLLIRGDSKRYEKYKYNKEMNVIIEYLFLFASVLSVILQTTEYAMALVPILLWYSAKQINTYYYAQKTSRADRKYMIEIMEKLEEINEIYIDNLEGRLSFGKYIDVNRLQCYQQYNVNRNLLFYFSKKRMKEVIDVIHNIVQQDYVLPRDIEKVRQDIFVALNKIVKCI